VSLNADPVHLNHSATTDFVVASDDACVFGVGERDGKGVAEGDRVAAFDSGGGDDAIFVGEHNAYGKRRQAVQEFLRTPRRRYTNS